MESVYEQLDKLLSDNKQRPPWVDEILFELKEIKTLLKKQQDRRYSEDYFKFVENFKKRLKNNLVDGKYPEIYFKGKNYGINLRGFIYDKETSQDIPAKDAFEIYYFLYKNKKNLEKFIKYGIIRDK